MKYIAFSCLILLLSSNFILAQNQGLYKVNEDKEENINPFATSKARFSTDTSVFRKQLEQFVFPVNDEAKKVGEKFIPYWRATNKSRQEKIIATCNLMRDHDVRKGSYVFPYLNAIMVSDTMGQSDSNTRDWQGVIDFMIRDKRYSIRSVLEFCDYTAISLSSRTIYKSRQKEWYVSSDQFHFSLDSANAVIIDFSNTIDIICRAYDDSSAVYNTMGYYNFYEQTWHGKGGDFYWDRTQTPHNEANASLSAYTIDTKKVEFSAENVALNYKFKGHQLSMTGTLTDKVTAHADSSNARFPTFLSDHGVSIPEFYPQIDYYGGLFISGKHANGVSVKRERSVINIKRDGEVICRALSPNFNFKTNGIITSENTMVSIKLENDSLYHPGVLFTYFPPQEMMVPAASDPNSLRANFEKKAVGRRVELNRTGKGISKSPFYDTYHNYDIFVELLYWELDGDIISFRLARGTTNNLAGFRSSNYFSEYDYGRMEKIGGQHSLLAIKSYLTVKNTELLSYSPQGISEREALMFKASDFAEFKNFPASSIRQLMVRLTIDGFVSYDSQTDSVLVRQRLFDHIAFSEGNKDYDVIAMLSDVFLENSIETVYTKEKARLNLSTMDLNIANANFVSGISTQQKVYVFPKDGNITLKQGGNMEFRGEVVAGELEFVGSERPFKFDYENYKLVLDSVDYYRIRNDSLDVNGNKVKEQYLQTVVYNISGDFYIDDPGNKSGKMNRDAKGDIIKEEVVFPDCVADLPEEEKEYPIFDSKTVSYVYYEEEKERPPSAVGTLEQRAEKFKEDLLIPEDKSKKIKAGVYSQADSFFFEVDPYIVTGLKAKTAEDTTNWREKWQLEGTFYSGGVFEPFRETLTILPDTVKKTISITDDNGVLLEEKDTIMQAYSFGFKHEEQKERSVYGGKGTAITGLRLSVKGLYGNGLLKYGPSTTYSDEIVFFPKSTNTLADSFYVAETPGPPEFPRCEGKGSAVHWRPFMNEMLVTSDVKYEDLLRLYYGYNPNMQEGAAGTVVYGPGSATDPDFNAVDTTSVKIEDNDPNYFLAGEPKYWRLLDGEINRKKNEKMIMYNNAKSGGAISEYSKTLVIKADEGMSGFGTMKFDAAELVSENFKFEESVYDATPGDFRLKSAGNKDCPFAFRANPVNAHIDFIAELGTFKPESETSYAQLCLIKYKVLYDIFFWDIQVNQLEFGSSEVAADTMQIKKEGSRWISTHPEQDSLSFISYKSGYGLDDHVLYCYEVDSIITGDCSVHPNPDSEVAVTIRQHVPGNENCNMDMLEQASIKIDTVNQYHMILNADVKITGRKHYTANGEYTYRYPFPTEQGIDTVSKVITFDNIVFARDTSSQSIANQTINEGSQFNLSADYEEYYGQVMLRGKKKFLYFSGHSHLVHECTDYIKSEALNLKCEINPDSVIIPVTRNLMADGGAVSFGFYSTEPEESSSANNRRNENENENENDFSSTSNIDSIYTAVFTKQSLTDDNVIVPVPEKDSIGVLYCDKNRNYIIADSLKIQYPDTAGNLVSFNAQNCTMHGEGELNLGIELGQVKVNTVGTIDKDMRNDSTVIDVLLTVDFFFDDDLLDYMTSSIGLNARLNSFDLSDPDYVNSLKKLVGYEDATKLTNRYLTEGYNYGRYGALPDKLKKTLVFPNLKMTWNPQTRSFISTGDINILFIGENEVKKQVPGYIELVKKEKTGDEITMYFELSENIWYFFQYARSTKGGTMYAISSGQDENGREFNKELSTKKEKHRKQKTESGDLEFTFMIGNPKNRERFLEKILIQEEEKLEEENEEDDGF